MGKFLTVDPAYALSFSESPYLFGGNNPIFYIDYNGNFKLSPRDQRHYPLLAETLRTISNIANQEDAIHDPIIEAFMESTGLSFSETKEVLTYNSGPRIHIRSKGLLNFMGGRSVAGLTKQNGKILIRKDLVQYMSTGKMGSSGFLTPEVFQIYILLTVLHEGVHHGDLKANGHFTDDDMVTDYKNADDGFMQKISKRGNSEDLGWKFTEKLKIQMPTEGFSFKDFQNFLQDVGAGKKSNDSVGSIKKNKEKSRPIYSPRSM